MSKNRVKVTLEVDDKGSVKIANFGKQTSKTLNQIDATGARLTKTLGAVGGALAAAFSARAIINAGQEAVRTGDNYDKMSKRVQASVEELSAFNFALQRSGSDLAAGEKALKYLAKTMGDFSRGTGEGKVAFEGLGIQVKKTDGSLRSTLSVLREAASKLSAMEDATLRVDYAQKLLGRSGTELLPLLMEQEGGLDRLIERSRALGGVWSTEDAKAAADLQDAVTDLTTAWEGLHRVMLVKASPFLQDWIAGFTDIVAGMNIAGYQGNPMLAMLQERIDEKKAELAAAELELKSKSEFAGQSKFLGWLAGGDIEDARANIDALAGDLEDLEEVYSRLEARFDESGGAAGASPGAGVPPGPDYSRDIAAGNQLGIGTDAHIRHLETLKQLRAEYDKTAKSANDFARESTRIYESLAESIDSTDPEAFALRDQLLQERYTRYREHLQALAEEDGRYADGVVLLDKWVEQERRELWEEWARNHGNILQTMSVAYGDFAEQHLSSSRALYDAWSGTFESIHRAGEDMLVDGFRNNSRSIADIWDNLQDYLIDTWIRTAYRIAMTEITARLGVNLAFAGMGGVVQGTAAGVTGSVAGGTAGGAAAGAGFAGLAAGATSFGQGIILGGQALLSGVQIGAPTASTAMGAGMSLGYYAPVGAAGYFGGEYFSHRILGQHGKYAGAGGATGAMIGMAVGGPPGAVIGALIGSAVGGIGPDKYKHAGTWSAALDIDPLTGEVTRSGTGLSGGAYEGIIAETLTDAVQGVMGEFPAWLKRTYQPELEEFFSGIEGQTFELFSRRYRDQLGDFEAMSAEIAEALVPDLEQMLAYYQTIAGQAGDLFKGAMSEAFGAATSTEGWGIFSTSLEAGLKNIMMSSMLDAVIQGAVVQRVLGPAIDQIYQEAARIGTSRIITTTVPGPGGLRIPVPVGTSTYTEADFAAEMASVLAQFEADMETLSPLFESMFGIFEGFFGGMEQEALEATGLISTWISPVVESWRDFLDSMTMSDYAPVLSPEMYERRLSDLYAKAQADPLQHLGDLQAYVRGEYLPWAKGYYGAEGDYLAKWEDLFGSGGMLSSMDVAYRPAGLDIAALPEAIRDALAPILVQQGEEWLIRLQLDKTVLSSVLLEVARNNPDFRREIQAIVR